MQRSFFFQWSQLQRKLAGLDSANQTAAGASGWNPNVDIFEGPDGLLIRVELAGVTPEMVEIQVDDQALVVRGIRRDPQGSETASGYRFRQMEIDFGPFERILPLPFAVDGAQARATFRNGILSIRLPRAPAPQATHIRIQVGAGND